MVELTSEDPFHSSYYYSVIITYLCLFAFVQILIYFYKYKSEGRARTLSMSIEFIGGYPDKLINEKNNLKIRYLIAYLLTRASIWAKSPFLFMLYSKYHGFTTSEIGVLYGVDAFSALVSGPLFGSLADKYGRKLFCMGYCVLNGLNLTLRLTGSIPLAYLAQVLTGFGAGLINTVFESWVVCESKYIFKDRDLEHEKYLKRLFKNQNLYDAIISLLVSGVSAVIFTNFGIFVTLFISMFYSTIAFFVIFFLWSENKPNEDSSNSKSEGKASSFYEALQELKKREVLSIGIIESVFQACLNLFIFSWTPLLLKSTEYTQINVGFIFVCNVIMMIIGTGLFEFVVVTLKLNYHLCLTGVLFAGMSMWCLTYFIDSFILRLIFLSVINGTCGFYLPLNSIIKSKILVEKHRATLMNIFRVPVNIYVIITLFALKFMDAFTICIIATVMMIIAFLTGVSLYLFPIKQDSLSEYELKFNDDEFDETPLNNVDKINKKNI